VFLFDEPLSNLDAKLRVQMRVEIKKLQRQLGVTSLYVTHDQVEAMTLSDKLVVMNGGRIEQMGLPNEVYRRPASKFVATFIGSPPMNILQGRVTGPNEVSIGDVRFGASLAAGVSEGAAVEIGLRPEDMMPRGDGPLPFDIEFVEELGATQLFHGSLHGAPLVVQAATDEISGDAKRLTLAIPADKVHVFDAGTGARLSA
jgi:sn-glycerol 3-phosphate transport system ATP-binding protein